MKRRQRRQRSNILGNWPILRVERGAGRGPYGHRKIAGNMGNSEYSVGLVDGGRESAEGECGVAGDLDDDNGGKQATQVGDRNQSA